MHRLVIEHCGHKPGDPYQGPLIVKGEWFDDRVLPFVEQLMKSPKDFLDVNKKSRVSRPASAKKDPTIHQGKLVLVFDSGEQYQEHFVLKANSASDAFNALEQIAFARLPFLAHSVHVTEINVPNALTKSVKLRGQFESEHCCPQEGASVIFNSEPGNGYGMTDWIKRYSVRWLHGVPRELYVTDNPWNFRPKQQFKAMLKQFATILESKNCVITQLNPLVVRGIIAHKLCQLPKRELRSKANKHIARSKRSHRPPGSPKLDKDGLVYFIQDSISLEIKIGFCLRNPEKRLAALQTGNANLLRLLGKIPGKVSLETALHKHFKPYRIHGEWFSSAILDVVNDIIKQQSAMAFLMPSPETRPS